MAVRPDITVVIATYNRAASVERLIRQLADQTVAGSCYEIIVVDDGSRKSVAPQLAALAPRCRVEVIEQANAGPAAARHNAIMRAAADLVVLVDDDMRVGPTFLAEHLAAHPAGSRRVALGPLRGRGALGLPLFERCHLALLEKLEADVGGGRVVLRGTNLYTGNVSLQRADYLAVGGFDQSFRLSEDTELGVRLEQAGARFVFAGRALSWHDSDHASLGTWLRRSRAYGAADACLAAKHPALPWASPWRFFTMMHPLARPFLALAVLAPAVAQFVAWAAMLVSMVLARFGGERIAIAGTTVVYGMEYFVGVRTSAGALRDAISGFLRHRDASRRERATPAPARLTT